MRGIVAWEFLGDALAGPAYRVRPSDAKGWDCMDEGRKRVLAIVARIVVVRHLKIAHDRNAQC